MLFPLIQEARQQFRLTGKVTIVDSCESNQNLAHLRVEQWQALSDSARLQFRYPAPGKRSTQADKHVSQPSPPLSSRPEDTFALLLLEPDTVDYVSLRSNERKLFSRERDNCWEVVELNP